jgi:peptide/nickel transport system substrate-binding protein
MAYAQVLQEDAKQAGIRITLNPMPSTQYWDGWTEFNMGITWWSHRPLAAMLLPLAYTADKDGKPVPWNESHWVNKDFQDLLEKAQGIESLDERRRLLCEAAKIMKEDAGICVPFFMNVWSIATKKVHDIEPSPEEFAIYHKAWIEA